MDINVWEAITMDVIMLRILSTLSSSLGDSLSINQLAERIKSKYGTGFYANIYRKLQNLKKESVLSLNLIGKSSIVKLNFQNYMLTDLLSEMEIERKMEFLNERTDLLPLIVEMEEKLKDKCSIKSISSINPTRNIKLNRLEFLFLLRKTSDYADEVAWLYRELQRLQNKFNLKIDNLILCEDDFVDLATSNEINPLREVLAKQTTLFCPQLFWSEIKRIMEKTEITLIQKETRPADISELDMNYNLSRFGYKEFGSAIEEGKRICIEYIVTALLLQNNARRTEAIPIILAKNDFKRPILTFLSQKFGTSGKLIGLLRTMQKIKPKRKVTETIKLLETFNVKEMQVDERSILEKMRLYNAA
jgi:hypothetical protein